MYKNVILAADGSTEALAAARVAKQYLESGIAEKLTIINVAPNYEDSALGTLANLDSMNNMAKDFGEQIVRETKVIFAEDANIDTHVVLGDPAMSISDYAKDNGCDLIIMGSRGKNPLTGLLLGSVSTRVLHFAPCQVLVVKE